MRRPSAARCKKSPAPGTRGDRAARRRRRNATLEFKFLRCAAFGVTSGHDGSEGTTALSRRGGRYSGPVVHSQHIKNVPGRNTDAGGSEWLAQLARFGLPRGSFIPHQNLVPPSA